MGVRKYNFVAEGDEGGVELVQTDHRDCDSVPIFSTLSSLGTELRCHTFHTNDVWQPVDEIFADLSQRATNDADGGFADVKFNDVGFISENDFLQFR